MDFLNSILAEPKRVLEKIQMNKKWFFDYSYKVYYKLYAQYSVAL